VARDEEPPLGREDAVPEREPPVEGDLDAEGLDEGLETVGREPAPELVARAAPEELGARL
jgi:hypothetical protein